MKTTIYAMLVVMLTTTIKIIIKTSPYLVPGILCAQQFNFGSNISDSSAGIWESNSPTNIHPNRRYQIIVNRKQQNYRGRRMFFDTVGVKNKPVPDNPAVVLSNTLTGEIVVSSFRDFSNGVTPSYTNIIGAPPATTVSITGTNAAHVTGSGGSYTIDVASPTVQPTPTITGTGIATSTSSGASYTVSVPATSLTVTGAAIFSQSSNSYTVSVLTQTTGLNNQTMTISGRTLALSGSGGTVAVPAQSLSISGNTISISDGGGSAVIPTQTVPINISYAGATTVSGSYPSFTISSPAQTLQAIPSTTLGVTGNSLYSVGGNTVPLPTQSVTIVGAGTATVGGSYPNFTIGVPTSTIYAPTSHTAPARFGSFTTTTTTPSFSVSNISSSNYYSVRISCSTVVGITGLLTTGATVTPQYFNGSTWVSFPAIENTLSTSIVQTDSKAMLLFISAPSAALIRFQITITSALLAGTTVTFLSGQEIY